MFVFSGSGGSLSCTTSDYGMRGHEFDSQWEPGFFIPFHPFASLSWRCTTIDFNFPTKLNDSCAAWGKVSLVFAEWAKKVGSDTLALELLIWTGHNASFFSAFVLIAPYGRVANHGDLILYLLTNFRLKQQIVPATQSFIVFWLQSPSWVDATLHNKLRL